MVMSLKGLVLAAGEGSRLRPFTFSRAKHLIPLLGKPMIRYAIDDLINSGIRDIGVVVGYFGDLIREVLGNGSGFSAKLNYIIQDRSACNTSGHRAWFHRQAFYRLSGRQHIIQRCEKTFRGLSRT
jgi:NDP-sugar pyrophosphorylase family protein